MNSESVLKFWFGEDLSLLNSPNYQHNPSLWFKPTWETDELIKEKFNDLFNQAENGKLDHDWLQQPKSTLALIILLDQFSRSFYRGTSKMFTNDLKALQLAVNLSEEEEKFANFSHIEKFFVFLTLSHSEDMSYAQKALTGCQELAKECFNVHKKNFIKYSHSIIDACQILTSFGRYPQRNELLGRTSTRYEQIFLKKHKHSYAKSVLPLKRTQHIPLFQKPIDSKAKLPYQKLLFLHGFRQNGNKIKKRMSKTLNYLKTECNAHVHFLNGTHPYVPQGEAAQQIKTTLGEQALNPIESQRVWYNSSDDATIYVGLDESLDHVMQHVKAHGPYDGVIGFSQGALVANILCRQNPSLFRYFISISGFKANAIKYKDLYSSEKPFEFVSMHIYGKNDTLVSPFRSRDLAKCFLNGVVFSHEAGHFAPDAWHELSHKIAEFINSQSVNVRPITFLAQLPFKLSILKLNEALVRSEPDQLDVECLFKTSFGKSLYKSSEFGGFFTADAEEFWAQKLKNAHHELDYVNDKLLIFYLLLVKNKELNVSKETNDNTAENNIYLTRILRMWLAIYESEADFNDYLCGESLERLFVDTQHWRELLHLCDLAFELKLTTLYELLIERFTSRILIDLTLLDSKINSRYIQELISENKVN